MYSGYIAIVLQLNYMEGTLPGTNSAPLKIGGDPKGTLVLHSVANHWFQGGNM